MNALKPIAAAFTSNEEYQTPAEQAIEIHQPVSAPVAMTPMEMVGRALEMGVSAEILKQMMDLRDREEARNARLAFIRAVAEAKAELRPIVRNAEVDYKPEGKPKVNYRHETLAGIEEQISETLSKHGLSYRYETENDPNMPISVTCLLEHIEGGSSRTTLKGPPDTGAGKNSLQAIASTVSYLERYTLKAALGLSVSHDDDGKAAGEPEGAGATITKEQLATILKLLSDTASDTVKFCRYYKIAQVPDLRAVDYDHAVESLNAKRAAQ